MVMTVLLVVSKDLYVQEKMHVDKANRCTDQHRSACDWAFQLLTSYIKNAVFLLHNSLKTCVWGSRSKGSASVLAQFRDCGFSYCTPCTYDEKSGVSVCWAAAFEHSQSTTHVAPTKDTGFVRSGD